MATKLSQVLFGQTFGDNQNDEKTASAPVKQDASAIRKILDVEQKQHEKEQKTDDKLIKAIVKLTDSMNKKDKALANKGGIGGWIAQKKSDIKSLFTAGGAAKAIGKQFGVEQNDGSLAGAVLGSITKRSEKKQQQKEFGANFQRFTKQGRELATAKDGESKNAAKKRAASAGAELFKKIDRRDTIIGELSAKQKQAEEFGGTLDEKDQLRLDAAKRSKQKMTDTMNGIDRSKKDTTPIEKDSTTKKEEKSPDAPISRENQVELMKGAVTGMRQEYDGMSDEEKQVFKDANPEVVNGMLEGSLDELTKISQKQLDALLDMLKLQQPSEEDRLESGIKSDNPLEEKKEKKEEKQGIFGKLFDFLKGGFSGFFKNALGSFASIAMKALGPIGTIISSVLAMIGKMGGGNILGDILGKGKPTTEIPDVDLPDGKKPTGKISKPSTTGNVAKQLGKFGRGALHVAKGAAAPLAAAGAVAGVMYGGVKLAEWAQENPQEALKHVPGAPKRGEADMTPAERILNQGGNDKDWIKKYKSQIELGTKWSKEEAAAIKQKYGLDVPIETKNTTTVTEKAKQDTKTASTSLVEKVKQDTTSSTNLVEKVKQDTTSSTNLVEKVKQDTTNSVIEKSAAPTRVEQSETLQQNTEIQKTKELEKEKLMMAKQQQAAPTIVQSPTNIVNNTSKINTRVAPRNLETQFNNRLRQIYA